MTDELKRELQTCIKYLEKHGEEIGLKAGQGDAKAQAVINTYCICAKGVDTPSAAVLLAAVADYQGANP